MKLNKILKSFLIVFAGFLITLNFMTGSALANVDMELDDYGYFIVDANNEQGFKVSYTHTYVPYGDFEFHAYGTWKGGPDIDECGPEGDPNYTFTQQMMDPQYDAFSLIINCDKYEDEEYQYSRNPRIPIYYGDTCAFLMNDSNYPDNTGALLVEYKLMN